MNKTRKRRNQWTIISFMIPRAELSSFRELLRKATFLTSYIVGRNVTQGELIRTLLIQYLRDSKEQLGEKVYKIIMQQYDKKYSKKETKDG